MPIYSLQRIQKKTWRAKNHSKSFEIVQNWFWRFKINLFKNLSQLSLIWCKKNKIKIVRNHSKVMKIVQNHSKLIFEPSKSFKIVRNRSKLFKIDQNFWILCTKTTLMCFKGFKILSWFSKEIPKYWVGFRGWHQIIWKMTIIPDDQCSTLHFSEPPRIFKLVSFNDRCG